MAVEPKAPLIDFGGDAHTFAHENIWERLELIDCQALAHPYCPCIEDNPGENDGDLPQYVHGPWTDVIMRTLDDVVEDEELPIDICYNASLYMYWYAQHERDYRDDYIRAVAIPGMAQLLRYGFESQKRKNAFVKPQDQDYLFDLGACVAQQLLRESYEQNPELDEYIALLP